MKGKNSCVMYTGLATRLAGLFLQLVLSSALHLHLLDCVQRTSVIAKTGLWRSSTQSLCAVLVSSYIKPNRWYSIDAFPSHLPTKLLSIHTVLVGEWRSPKWGGYEEGQNCICWFQVCPFHLQNKSISCCVAVEVRYFSLIHECNFIYENGIPWKSISCQNGVFIIFTYYIYT